MIKIGNQIYNYKIISLIAEGGMGSVYYAIDLLNKKLAIKTINPQLLLNSENIKRFLREAKTLSALDHPNIVRIYNLFEYDNSYVMVMEYAEGITLNNLINRTGPISESRTLPIFKQIAGGLLYAHSKGVIHRDLKPDNIIIDECDKIKILDFGIAKIMNDTGLTRTGLNMGTLAYMSPEQIMADKNIDNRSDIYSLGILLYEMLTGSNPHCIDAESDFEIMKVIVEGEIKDPRNKYPHISQKTVDLIKSMTIKNKNERMGSLVNALNNVFNGSNTTILENNEYSGSSNSNRTRILNKDIINELPEYTFCKHCGEELELELEDFNSGKYKCPNCRKINNIDLSLIANKILSISSKKTEKTYINYNGTNIDSNKLHKQERKRNLPSYIYLIGGIIFLIAVCVIFILIENSSVTNEKKSFYNTTSSDITKPEKERPQPLPENGKVINYSSKKNIAPLRINTAGRNYFVKLIDKFNNKLVQTIFIRSGNDVEVKVPLGSYILKYASGDIWYGEDKLFGESTVYHKADEIFKFETKGNRVHGWTIDLRLQFNGNLKTENISENEF